MANFKIIEISESQFLRLSKLVTKEIGIKLPLEKRILFQSRLQSRLNELGLESFDAYSDYLFKAENILAELSVMTDLISTNKTEFFREKEHFNLLFSSVLPELFGTSNKTHDRFLKCWSAGCSSGQEAFSLAMIFEEFKLINSSFNGYQILGTDISKRMLDVAGKGIFPFAQKEQIPIEYLKKYVLKSKDNVNPRIKVIQSLQSKIEFKYSNLMDENYDFPFQFKIIFIRNTLIYFSQEKQLQVLRKVLERLLPGGYLFIGHSESLINMGLPIKLVWPSVYKKTR